MKISKAVEKHGCYARAHIHKSRCCFLRKIENNKPMKKKIEIKIITEN